MNKLITRLALSITLVGGMLLPATRATAQQEITAPHLQLLESSMPGEFSQLRSDRSDDLEDLKTSKYLAKDIDGKTYDIDAILKSGRAILIDFSATWCNPCWMIHNSGALDRLLAKFGPNGTKQLEVFWVEASDEPIAAIKGNVNTCKKGPTWGDWTKDSNGNPVPYPIFSDSKMSPALGIPVLKFPTVVLIGPDKKWLECVNEIFNLEKFAELLDLFIKETDKPRAVELAGPTDLYVGETHTMRLSYKTIAPVTSVEWKASEGITLKKVRDTEYQVIASKLGSYDIEATVTNANGSTTSKVTVVVSEPISSYPFFCGMDKKDQLDKGWRSIDHDGDGFGFDSYMGKGLIDRLSLKESTKPGAEQSADYLLSWGSFLPKTAENAAGGGVKFSGKKINPNNELRSAPLVIPADASKPTFSCYITSVLTSVPTLDQLKVMVSELNGIPVEVLAPQRPKKNGWKLISVDLSAYKGKTILLSLIPVVNGQSGIGVDQLRVSMDGQTDVEAPTLNLETTLYPNPASDHVNVQTRVGSTIELFATDGTMLSTTQATNERTTIALTQLPAGRYIVRITSLEGEVVFRPLIIE